MSVDLRAPFPWFGGKSRVADLVWNRFGNVPNYVEPFFGSGAVLLSRPHEAHTETINDKDCFVANFWRALQNDPEAVAAHADNPVNEAAFVAGEQRGISRVHENRPVLFRFNGGGMVGMGTGYMDWLGMVRGFKPTASPRERG